MSVTQVNVQGPAAAAGLSDWIKRHPVFTAVFLAYAFVWVIAFPQLAHVPIPGIVAYFVGTLGPLWAALMVEGAETGASGYRARSGLALRWSA